MNRKIIAIVLTIVLLLGIGGGVVWHFSRSDNDDNGKSITGQEYDDSEKVRLGVKDIEKRYLNSLGYMKNTSSVNALFDEICEYLEEQKKLGLVDDYTRDDGVSIYIEMKSGIGILFSPKIYGQRRSGSELKIATFEPAKDDALANDILATLATFEIQSILKGMTNHSVSKCSEMIEELEENYSYKSSLLNDDVTVESLKTIGQYKIVIWEGHGGYNSKVNSALITGEKRDKSKEEKNGIYSKDIVKQKWEKYPRVSVTNDGYYYVTSEFFNHYLEKNKMDNSLIYLGACYSGCGDGILAKSFLSNGAKAVYAYSDTVSMIYEMLMRSCVFDTLCSENPNGGYYTATEALNIAKARVNKQDCYSVAAHINPLFLLFDSGLTELLLFPLDETNDFRLVETLERV